LTNGYKRVIEKWAYKDNSCELRVKTAASHKNQTLKNQLVDARQIVNPNNLTTYQFSSDVSTKL